MARQLWCAEFRITLCLLFVTVTFQAKSQSQLLPTSRDLNLKLGRQIYFDSSSVVHPALGPLFSDEVANDSATRDSLLVGLNPKSQEWQKKNWIYRKLFLEHLIEVNDSGYTFYLDFLPDLQIGRGGSENLWLNTRGLELGGRIGKGFAFTSYFFENQARFPRYYTNYATENRVIPGQGRARSFGKYGFDYAYSGGTLSYTPSRYVNFQLGYDKNFIGDGYRSLLLSDNAFNYPFLKVTVTLGKVRYMAMYAQLIDFYEHFDLERYNQDNPYPKKNALFHYLSWNVSRRLSIGLFENVMWQPRGFDFSYVNPLVFARPVEFANGSPDKVLAGVNASYKIADRYVVYGQFMLNEFRGKDFFSGKGHWATKHGEQLGIKGFDIFKLERLNAQVEFNTVRPYSYSSKEHFTNYGHYNQPLAHPFGANFREFLAIATYRYRRVDFRVQATSAMYGLDQGGLNFGKDIYKSYDTRVSEDGIFTGNGLRTNLYYADARLAYILNPKNNLRLELGFTWRREKNVETSIQESFFNIGLRSSFRSLYTDF
ncbi:hypothetical protein [Pedobacter deserti]|uniref:hypothetical protein n=1 Tax=Pedobacter deserti TaxID=2817382 RepID=UPI00210D3609|nr:hypothetical protein [Pedobacter sp. SYSU D00382]